jgi:hypothetical protein
MSYLYYEIAPYGSKGELTAYILRVFIKKGGHITCLETKAFPITNPRNYKATHKRADLYGKMTVAALRKGGAK